MIGGGLTGIDTATELFAYYPVQVEKTLERYEALCAERGDDAVRGRCTTPRNWRSSTSSSSTAARCAPSGSARRPPASAPDFVPLVRGWGGVTLAYRKRLADSPAYRLNHEEVIKALEEGIWFAENLDPARDHRRRAATTRDALMLQGADDGPVELPARTVLVAAGTSPNMTYEKEHPARSSSMREASSSRGSALSANRRGGRR